MHSKLGGPCSNPLPRKCWLAAFQTFAYAGTTADYRPWYRGYSSNSEDYFYYGDVGSDRNAGDRWHVRGSVPDTTASQATPSQANGRSAYTASDDDDWILRQWAYPSDLPSTQLRYSSPRSTFIAIRQRKL